VRACGSIRRIAALTLGSAWLAAQAQAAPPEPQEGAPAPKPAAIPIDQLLKLPVSYQQRSAEQTHAGATKKEWQERFRSARDALEIARAELARTRKELEALAGQSSSWQVAAPGQPAPSENSPLSFRLRQEIRRRSEALEDAERDLQDLEIRANLAEVPEDWR
jgi:hypothetical protein